MVSREKLNSFLEAQKRRNLELDEAEGLLDRERTGQDYPKLRERLYENTIKWVQMEAGNTLRPDLDRIEDTHLHEDTVSTDIATFTTQLLPAIRRIYTKLIAMELVSVQPMNGPSSILYWIDHKFGTAYGAESISVGDRLDQTRAKEYATSGEKGTIREVNYSLESDTITAVTKKIKGQWTIEAEQDLRSQWGLNIEAELMPKTVEEVVREVDYQVINALLAGVGHNANWNANGALTEDLKYTFHKKEYDATLYDKILEVNNEIFKVKGRNANWIVVHPDAYLRLSKLEKFNTDPLAQENMSIMGRRYVGTLGGGMFKCYVDPDFPDSTKILLGFKGDNWQYACGYYAPYIPLFTSPKYIVGDDFTQFFKGAMTRYAYGIIPENKTGSLSDRNLGLGTVTITSS